MCSEEFQNTTLADSLLLSSFYMVIWATTSAAPLLPWQPSHHETIWRLQLGGLWHRPLLVCFRTNKRQEPLCWKGVLVPPVVCCSSFFYPPGCSHHGVKMAPHHTDELMGAAKPQPVRLTGPWSQDRMNPALNWVPHCKVKNTKHSWGSGLFQETEDNHLHQSWEELLLLCVRNYHHILSSKPIADSNEFELLITYLNGYKVKIKWLTGANHPFLGYCLHRWIGGPYLPTRI